MKTVQKYKANMAGAFAAAVLLVAGTPLAQAKDIVKLQFSDGRDNVAGVENVNAVLHSIGVHASTLPIPEEAKPILKASQTRAIRDEEQRKLISIFNLHRGQLLEQVQLAGRTPVAPRGGYLSTTELDTPPYPKVYDMMALTPEVHKTVLNKYGRLHVNTSDNGMGIDEVMTVVSGGPFTWVFVMPDGVLARLTVDRVSLGDPAIRLSYPGLGMHAGYMDPKQGVIVAFAHGPKNFVMRYEEPSVPHAELLGTNAWVDFSGDMPKLRDQVK
ncbi:hypothetical protein [Ralstonia solanacearum]|nr:hypothetical protein [Ralstonia solanacearum]AEG71833.1 hypothetical transmembrane protein [Ralstonia solanacearum Po82]AMP71710.1 hypothetical protein UW163_19680 [Ralstonia solanacearum]AMP76361.1 hypothetical protein RALBFv3_19470 [Ralstonia solanacearum]EUJ12305.1 membrane protein [Ralstonia solanacearum P673]MBB6588835.1 hypothetical protein [Ralstonia solanacearum]